MTEPDNRYGTRSILFAGLGEQPQDLVAFNPEFFINGILNPD